MIQNIFSGLFAESSAVNEKFSLLDHYIELKVYYHSNHSKHNIACRETALSEKEF